MFAQAGSPIGRMHAFMIATAAQSAISSHDHEGHPPARRRVQQRRRHQQRGARPARTCSARGASQSEIFCETTPHPARAAHARRATSPAYARRVPAGRHRAPAPLHRLRVNDVFAALPCRKAILYHNITPPEYFRGVQEQIAHVLARGREQAKRLAGAAEVEPGRQPVQRATNCEAWGYRDVEVLPLVLDLRRLRDAAEPRDAAGVRRRAGRTSSSSAAACRTSGSRTLLAAFHYFQRYVEPDVALDPRRLVRGHGAATTRCC